MSEIARAVDAELARLHAHRATLDHARFDANRAQAGRRALQGVDPATALARKYESAAALVFDRTLKQIHAFRREQRRSLAEERTIARALTDYNHADEVFERRDGLGANPATGARLGSFVPAPVLDAGPIDASNFTIGKAGAFPRFRPQTTPIYPLNHDLAASLQPDLSLAPTGPASASLDRRGFAEWERSFPAQVGGETGCLDPRRNSTLIQRRSGVDSGAVWLVVAVRCGPGRRAKAPRAKSGGPGTTTTSRGKSSQHTLWSPSRSLDRRPQATKRGLLMANQTTIITKNPSFVRLDHENDEPKPFEPVRPTARTGTDFTIRPPVVVADHSTEQGRHPSRPLRAGGWAREDARRQQAARRRARLALAEPTGTRGRSWAIPEDRHAEPGDRRNPRPQRRAGRGILTGIRGDITLGRWFNQAANGAEVMVPPGFFVAGFVKGMSASIAWGQEPTGYRSPYRVEFSTSLAELVGDLDRTERGDPRRAASIPFAEWYSDRTRERWQGWGPSARDYPPPVGWERWSTERRRERVVAVALRFQGYAYQHHHIPDWDPPRGWPGFESRTGAIGPGVDCSNLTGFAYNLGCGLRLNTDVARQAEEWVAEGPGRRATPLQVVELPASFEGRRHTLRTGDLVFIRGRTGAISHVMIWVGAIGRALDGVPLVLDSHGAEARDSEGQVIPRGVHLRPCRADSWYHKRASHALRVFAD